MNEARRTSASHLNDAELVRLVDGQLDLHDGRRARGHLAACAECAARLESLRAESARVSAWIAELPVDAPGQARRALTLAAAERAASRRRARSVQRTALLRVAAALVALLAATLATTPGRAWMGDRVEALVGARPGDLAGLLLDRIGLAPAEPEPLGMETVPTIRAAPPPGAAGPAPSHAAPRRQAAESAEVAFSPPGPEVVLEFRSRQEAGTATLHFRDAERATARISGGGAGERLVPRPGGLEVRNGPGSVAAYTVVVPTRYRLLRVRVADAPEIQIRIAPSRQEWIWTLDLQAEAMR